MQRMACIKSAAAKAAIDIRPEPGWKLGRSRTEAEARRNGGKEARRRRRSQLSHPRARLFRGPGAQAPCRRLLLVGARRRRGHLRRFFRLESRFQCRRLGRHVPRRHRHHHHVSRPHLLDRRDEPGAAAYRRRLFLRAHRLRALGRFHYRRRRERRICADAGRDRLFHRRLSHRDLRHARLAPAGLVDRRLCRLRRRQCARR